LSGASQTSITFVAPQKCQFLLLGLEGGLKTARTICVVFWYRPVFFYVLRLFKRTVFGLRFLKERRFWVCLVGSGTVKLPQKLELLVISVDLYVSHVYQQVLTHQQYQS
jgi:hypothetical protein